VLNYDNQLLEKLRTLRKKLANDLNIAPFMIFSEVALQEMAYYFPLDKDSFLNIGGVGKSKLEKFGEVFLSTIEQYVEENNITPLEVPDRQIRRRSKPRKTVKSGGGYIKTKEMISKKMSLSEMAKEQGVKELTIASHIEKLIEKGEELNIDYLKPPEEIYQKIKVAFGEQEDDRLKPVYEYLGEKYSYDAIRFTRMIMRAENVF